MMANNAKIPIHVITGFLGTGKTTLLNQLLKHEAFCDSAVIINEFGETSLDHLLVDKSDDQIIELANGCICCTVRGQLIDTLEQVVVRAPKRIIIETTGLANPLPVLQAIIHAPSINDVVEFAGLITIADSSQGEQMLSAHEEARRQIALSDLVVLTKLDVKPSSAGLVDAITAINPVVKIITKTEFLEDSKQLLNTNATHLIATPTDAHHHLHDVNSHSDTIGCVTLGHDMPIEYAKIEMFVQLLLSAHGAHVLRLKGLVNIAGKQAPLLLQSVGSILSEPLYLKNWPSEDDTTRIVVFLDGMEPNFIERLFAGFIGLPQIDTPDDQALMNNPLAVLGTGSGFKPL